MLKINNDVDLKVLEEFGFKYSGMITPIGTIRTYLKYINKFRIRGYINVDYYTRELKYSNSLDIKYYNLNLIYIMKKKQHIHIHDFYKMEIVHII